MTRGGRFLVAAVGLLLVVLAAPAGRPIGPLADPLAGPLAGSPAGALADPAVVRLPEVRHAPEAVQAPEDAPRLEMESQTAFVDPRGVFQVVVTAPDAPAGVQLRVRVHPSVASVGRLRFEATIDGRSLGTPLLSLPPIDVAAATAFGGGSLGVPIAVVPDGPAPPGGVTLGEAGVYPVSVQLTTATGDPLDSFVTHLVRLPEPPPPEPPDSGLPDPGLPDPDGAGPDDTSGLPPLAFATIVPFEGPPAFRADRTWDVDRSTIDRLAATATVLDEVDDVDVTLDPLPETLAALAEVDGGLEVLEPLGRATAGRQVTGRTWVPVDVGSWAASDLDVALRHEVTTGAAAVEATLGREPTSGSTVLDPTVDPDGLTLLRELGTTRVVVPDDLLSPLDPDDFPVTLTQAFEVVDGSGAPVRAVAADRGLASRLTATDDPVLAAHLVLADLAVLRLDLEGVERGASLVVPGDADPRLLQTLLEGLAEPHATPLVEAVTIDELFARVPVARADGGDDPTDPPLRRTWRSDPPTTLSDYALERTRTEEGLAGYRSLLGPDATRWIPLDTLIQTSGDRRLSPADQEELLVTVQGLIGDDIARITIPEGQSITLTAEEGTLPLVLDNGLDVPVRVELRLTSDRLEFPEGDRVEAVLEPGSNRVEVTVRSRASGAFPLDVGLGSPDQTLELDEARVTVRSTAISGLGIVLSVGAGVFLAVWWIRNHRSTRRARRLVSPAHPTARAAPEQPEGQADEVDARAP